MYTIYVLFKDIYILYRYLYTNRLAAMIYTQRYKTTTCSKVQGCQLSIQQH